MTAFDWAASPICWTWRRATGGTAYVDVSNSALGVLLLVFGALAALASSVSVDGTVLLLGLSGLAGVALSLRWPEISH